MLIIIGIVLQKENVEVHSGTYYIKDLKLLKGI